MSTSLSGNIATLRLGQTRGDIYLGSREDNQEVSLSMAGQTQHSIYIFSHSLDASIYNNAEFADAVSTTARRSRHARIHILIHDSTAIVKHGHRLLTLSQQLSSVIQIRRITREYQRMTQAFMVADKIGIVDRPNENAYEGIANYRSPVRALELSRLFDTIWEVSLSDPDLQRLSI